VCRDRGSVTVWAAALAGLIWLAAMAAVLYGAAVTGRHRTETAADLAALAAAIHLPDGEPTACSTAAAIAIRNGGELRGCRVAGDDVEVEVATRISLGRLGVRAAVARARAGPVDEQPTSP
jgi:secretion/DNA translocation related TadE-like protein